MEEVKVGRVVEYFAKIGVAGIQIEGGTLRLGDTIHIRGHTTDFEQRVESMELEHKAIEIAEPGQLVGIRVRERVREKDAVYKVIPG